MTEMILTNRWDLSPMAVRAVRGFRSKYTRMGALYSVTDLIAAPRRLQLTRRHEQEITRDVGDLLFAMDGQADHGVVEATAHPHILAEARWFVELDGVLISGQPDQYTMLASDTDAEQVQLEDGVLYDYKRTSVWSVKDCLEHGVKPEWEAQLNLYALLVEMNGGTVTGLRLEARARDWRWSEYDRLPRYPRPWEDFAVPLWTQEQALAYARRRIALHTEAEWLSDDQLPACTPEERWHRRDLWAHWRRATRRDGTTRSRPTKVYDTEGAALDAVEADDPANEPAVEYRPGRSIRCERYCDARPFCSQAACAESR